MGRISADTIRDCVRAVCAALPRTGREECAGFIRGLPGPGDSPPKPEIHAGSHWFCLRSYRDTFTDDRCLQAFVGTFDSTGDYLGYDRIDPCWLDECGRDDDGWELTRAYVKPKSRGRGYCSLLVELVLELAGQNHARWVVAYPRHVGMLVTLLDYGFGTVGGSLDATLGRIREEGRNNYARDARQRRLVYAEEFRPFIQDGSFLMRRRVGRTGLWAALTRDF